MSDLIFAQPCYKPSEVSEEPQRFTDVSEEPLPPPSRSLDLYQVNAELIRRNL